MNRLANEKSPYLLMHANNPVDWYPWGQEAFDAAKEQDKPVFLSIGYSSCHWCHVIAHESFENEGVAAILNKHFLSVKVDKEERPDVDAVYMEAVELETGAGGWPMTLIITPEGAPFYAATYLPHERLVALLNRAATLWQTQRPLLTQAAESLSGRMREAAGRTIQPKEPSPALASRALKAFASAYDEKWGGFGRAPKFPAAHNLLFLLAHHEKTGDADALNMVEGTLTSMFRGGIFDHVGGGWCRYSVDRKWLVPHFEKMLYDNALLIWAISRAWTITQSPLYRAMAERTVSYVLRDMTSPDGAFCAAQDADSGGREGAFYLFTRGEIVKTLGEGDGARFCDAYDVTREGNFEGMSIPNLIENKAYAQAEAELGDLRERVRAWRALRMPLMRDDKVLTSWNALMIAALCVAAESLERPDYLEAAKRAEAFLDARLTKADGGLFLRFREGEAKGEGVLSDYAYYALALTKLYQATGEETYLKRAQTRAEYMLAHFSDARGGGLYLYSDQGETLVTRPKETWDAAMPSGNACAALVFTELARLTGKETWKEAARTQLRFVAGAAGAYPTAHGFGLLAITQALSEKT